MKTLTELIIEHQLIQESNIRLFPSKRGQHEKLEIWVGDHCKQRQQERNVTDRQILDAVFGAYKDIKNLYKEGKLKLSKNGNDYQFVITDARKHKNNPIVVVGFIYKMLGSKNPSDINSKFDRPLFTIKTVFHGDDFSGSKADRSNAQKIFLY